MIFKYWEENWLKDVRASITAQIEKWNEADRELGLLPAHEAAPEPEQQEQRFNIMQNLALLKMAEDDINELANSVILD